MPFERQDRPHPFDANWPVNLSNFVIDYGDITLTPDNLDELRIKWAFDSYPVNPDGTYDIRSLEQPDDFNQYFDSLIDIEYYLLNELTREDSDGSGSFKIYRTYADQGSEPSTIPWENPDNAREGNGVYTTATKAAPIAAGSNTVISYTDYLIAEQPVDALAIPPGKELAGFEVKVKYIHRTQTDAVVGLPEHNNVTTFVDWNVYPVKNGTVQITAPNLAKTIVFDELKQSVSPSGEEVSVLTATYGGANDKWGLTWTREEANTQFGIALKAKLTQDPEETITKDAVASIDSITLKIYTTDSGGGGGEGGGGCIITDASGSILMGREWYEITFTWPDDWDNLPNDPQCAIKTSGPHTIPAFFGTNPWGHPRFSIAPTTYLLTPVSLTESSPDRDAWYKITEAPASTADEPLNFLLQNAQFYTMIEPVGANQYTIHVKCFAGPVSGFPGATVSDVLYEFYDNTGNLLNLWTRITHDDLKEGVCSTTNRSYNLGSNIVPKLEMQSEDSDYQKSGIIYPKNMVANKDSDIIMAFLGQNTDNAQNTLLAHRGGAYLRRWSTGGGISTNTATHNYYCLTFGDCPDAGLGGSERAAAGGSITRTGGALALGRSGNTARIMKVTGDWISDPAWDGRKDKGDDDYSQWHDGTVTATELGAIKVLPYRQEDTYQYTEPQIYWYKFSVRQRKPADGGGSDITVWETWTNGEYPLRVGGVWDKIFTYYDSDPAFDNKGYSGFFVSGVDGTSWTLHRYCCYKITQYVDPVDDGAAPSHPSFDIGIQNTYIIAGNKDFNMVSMS